MWLDQPIKVKSHSCKSQKSLNIPIDLYRAADGSFPSDCGCTKLEESSGLFTYKKTSCCETGFLNA